MSKKDDLKALVKGKCKDMGLSQQVLDELVTLAYEGATDETTAEELETRATGVVPYAKAIQAEVTRISQKNKQQPVKPQQPTEPLDTDNDNKGSNGSDDNKNKGNDSVPEWAKTLQKRVDALSKENETLKAEQRTNARREEIAKTAKRLNIPDYLMKRISIAEDADIEQELKDYKQDLVNHKLVSEQENAGIIANTDEQLKADAKAWAEGLK